jgi:hypothetical protein
VIAAIERLMAADTAGDPITGLKWTRKTTQGIARELKRAGIRVSRNTVGRLLRQLHYSLRVNHKKLSRACSSRDRDRQFRYLQATRQSFQKRHLPIVSVDTKKKELIGRFKNPGAAWVKAPVLVNDHDFRSQARGLAVPYGVYDVTANRGHVLVGLSYDTSAFAVDALAGWWQWYGRFTYPGRPHLLVLADAGGSNSASRRSWKHALQTQLCNRFHCSVTVGHYPPGASKWNPIEHRLFSQISRNWAGQPLESLQTMLNYLRTTRTTTGLRVTAALTRRTYPKGIRVSDEEMTSLNLRRHAVFPKWNYTLRPQRTANTPR